jgi:hypothetical protein
MLVWGVGFFIWVLLGFICVDSNLNCIQIWIIVWLGVGLENRKNHPHPAWAGNLEFSLSLLSAHAQPTKWPSTRRPTQPTTEPLTSTPPHVSRPPHPLSSSSFSPFPLPPTLAPRCRHGKVGRAAEPTVTECFHASRGVSRRPRHLPPPINLTAAGRAEP